MVDRAELFVTLRNAVEGLIESKRAGGQVPTNAMTVPLLLISKLDGRPLIAERFESTNRGQVRGLSGAAIRRILHRHDERRAFTTEGGRTSRGSIAIARDFASIVNSSLFSSSDMSDDDITWVADQLEAWLVDKLQREYFDRQLLAPDLRRDDSVDSWVVEILEVASKRRASGAVAQHLVGAALQLLVPGASVGVDHHNAGDLQTGRDGDFTVGDYALHVTTAPSEHLFVERAGRNRRDGIMPLILVPQQKVEAARQLAENADLGRRVRIESISGFITGTLEVRSAFRQQQVREGFGELLSIYNERIELAEPDLSLRIDIPYDLVGR